ELLTQKTLSDASEQSEIQSQSLFPWYSPLEILMACGSKSGESLSRWIPSAVEGLVFPVRSTRISFALIRPKVAPSLRERGFRSVTDA
ncbi:MAG: hypothetical protein LW850_10300, partial [Planctomycetaceae bacterium]|nr:hypothetical protein [Planctomycetaceae bacterium]